MKYRPLVKIWNAANLERGRGIGTDYLSIPLQHGRVIPQGNLPRNRISTLGAFFLPPRSVRVGSEGL